MQLFYKEYGHGDMPIIILHGLLGSGRNWHSIAASLAERHRVIVPDLRNHGRSPHSDEHHISDMVIDIVDLQHKLSATPAVVLGHSMGGLVVMELAFRAPEQLAGAIVADIVPKSHLSGVSLVLEAMSKLDLASFAEKQEIDEALARAIADPLVRQFVLTNVAGDDGFRWRINLPALQRFLPESNAYRPGPTDVFNGPTLFVRGGRSDYVTESDFPLIKHHFPEAEIETIAEAGHWVHYEAPAQMLQLIETFMKESVLR